MSEIEGSIRFEVLGPIRARIGDSEITVSARRDRIMLAMLLLHAPDPVPLSRLVEAIWGDQPPHNFRNQVQGCVSRWRKRFADAGVQRQVIVTDQAGYQVPVELQDLDLLEFRRLCDEARSAAADGRPTEAYERYRAALGLWRGPALVDIDSALAGQVAASLDEEHIQAQEECLRLALEHNLAEPGALVAEIRALARQHPYREAVQADLLRALYRAGRQADALAAYRDYRQRLSDDLGTEPGDELQHLHRAVLNRDPELDAPRPSPLASATLAAPAPRELPAQVPGFTGRADALATLDDLLSEQSAGTPGPVVVPAIAGTAGVGKTALAVHWAHRVADRFPDGQLYLNLRGYASGPPVRPIEALAALLRALGVPSERVPTEQDEAAALLRTTLADRRTLMVLDNARSVDQVRPLLPGSPRCLVLVTSRNRLSGLVARDGARRIDLDVLTPDEARTLLRHMLSASRVEAEPVAAAELAAACAHLPLALRIAAAHIADRPARTIASYVAELTTGDRLGALQADGDQESSVLATLDLSYRALPPDATHLFRLLGMVPGPDVTPAAAAALIEAADAEATRLLQVLVNAHLVEEHAPGRYTFHDLLRLFARHLTRSEDQAQDRTAALERLFDHYLRTIEAAADLLYGEMLRLPVPGPRPSPPPIEFRQRADAVSWLHDEASNLVSAVRHGAAHGPRPRAWLLADYLRGYFWHSRRSVDWLSVAYAALDAATKDDDLYAQTAAELSLADCHLCMDRHQEANEHYTRASELARQAGWISGQATALSNCGIVNRVTGQLQKAAECYEQALRLHERTGRVSGQASVSTNLGTVYLVLGRLHDAVDLYQKALALYRALGSVSGEATVIRNLGSVSSRLGQLDRARQYFARSLALSREVGTRSGEAVALTGLATVAYAAGRPREALGPATTALEVAVEIGDHRFEAVALIILGRIQPRLGQLDEAERRCHAALALTRKTGDLYDEADGLLALSALHHSRGDYEAAVALAQQALDLTRRVGYRVLEANALTALAESQLRQGRYQLALDTADQALDGHRATGHRPGEARTLAVLGHIRYGMDERQTANQLWLAAADLFTETGTHVPEELQPPDGG